MAIIIRKAPKISLDLAARRVCMASMLYYGLEVSIMTDGEFDALCNRLADNWKSLSKQRQLCLGNPDEIRASGFNVKVTTLAENAAVTWMEKVGLNPTGRRVMATYGQNYLKGIGHWRAAPHYRWATSDEK